MIGAGILRSRAYAWLIVRDTGHVPGLGQGNSNHLGPARLS